MWGKRLAAVPRVLLRCLSFRCHCPSNLAISVLFSNRLYAAAHRRFRSLRRSDEPVARAFCVCVLPFNVRLLGLHEAFLGGDIFFRLSFCVMPPSRASRFAPFWSSLLALAFVNYLRGTDKVCTNVEYVLRRLIHIWKPYLLMRVSNCKLLNSSLLSLQPVMSCPGAPPHIPSPSCLPLKSQCSTPRFPSAPFHRTPWRRTRWLSLFDRCLPSMGRNAPCHSCTRSNPQQCCMEALRPHSLCAH